MRITITDEEAREIYKLLKSEYDSLPARFHDKPVVSMGRNRIKLLANKLGYNLGKREPGKPGYAASIRTEAQDD